MVLRKRQEEYYKTTYSILQFGLQGLLLAYYSGYHHTHGPTHGMEACV